VVSIYTDPLITQVGDITAGPDGALWFIDGASIGRITTDGTVSSFTSPKIVSPISIAAGPDGSLWITDQDVRSKSIDKMTTSGVVTKYPVPAGGCPYYITAGPDNAMWFDCTFSGGGSIGRVTTTGQITIYHNLRQDYDQHMTSGADGRVWFANTEGASIGAVSTTRFVTTVPTQGASGTPLAISGKGFTSGETVIVKLRTGLSSAKWAPLCTTVADSTGKFSCSATVPSTAGGAGTHTIRVKGSTSKLMTQGVFLLTA
jgi:streptogramin lyase